MEGANRERLSFVAPLKGQRTASATAVIVDCFFVAWLALILLCDCEVKWARHIGGLILQRSWPWLRDCDLFNSIRLTQPNKRVFVVWGLGREGGKEGRWRAQNASKSLRMYLDSWRNNGCRELVPSGTGGERRDAVWANRRCVSQRTNKAPQSHVCVYNNVWAEWVCGTVQS